MICDQCGIPGYVETASCLCPSCERAAREQEAKGDGELDEALSLLSLWWEHGDKGDHEEARLLHRDTNALLRRHGR